MPFVIAHKSDIGRNPKRKNEDYILVDESLGLYIVADGMGGQEAGEVASELTCTTVAEAVRKQRQARPDKLTPKTIETMIIGALETANEAVSKAAKAAEQRRKMGATIVV
ncbi:MAG: protein phosphatase 2C domain-containing protein, partial [Anaerolineae bacterium]|nr:protein phosphatase 2C domain-containing protein [Anaerolineae bacterium]